MHHSKRVKDLSRLGRDMKDIILIDDSPYASQGFETNTLLIAPYQPHARHHPFPEYQNADPKYGDKWLSRMLVYLENLKSKEDVRFRNRRTKLGTLVL